MNETLDTLQKTLEPYPWTYNITMIGALLLLAWVANWLTKRVLLRGLRHAIQASHMVRESDAQLKVIPRLANVVPALVLWLGVGWCRTCLKRWCWWCATSAARSSS